MNKPIGWIDKGHTDRLRIVKMDKADTYDLLGREAHGARFANTAHPYRRVIGGLAIHNSRRSIRKVQLVGNTIMSVYSFRTSTNMTAGGSG